MIREIYNKFVTLLWCLVSWVLGGVFGGVFGGCKLRFFVIVVFHIIYVLKIKKKSTPLKMITVTHDNSKSRYLFPHKILPPHFLPFAC